MIGHTHLCAYFVYTHPIGRYLSAGIEHYARKPYQPLTSRLKPAPSIPFMEEDAFNFDSAPAAMTAPSSNRTDSAMNHDNEPAPHTTHLAPEDSPSEQEPLSTFTTDTPMPPHAASALQQNTPHTSHHDWPELERILSDHERWLATDGREGRRAQLKDMDLRNANLKGRMLAGANLRSSNLEGLDLTGCDFTDADLSEANLTRVQASNVNFTRITANHTCFNHANLSNVDISYADLANSSWHYTNLNNARLDNANLREASMQHVNAKLASLKHTIARAAQLQKANLESADCTSTDFRDAALDEANIAHALLTDTNLRGVSMEGVAFKHVNLSGVQELDVATQQRIHDIQQKLLAEERTALETGWRNITTQQQQMQERSKEQALAIQQLRTLTETEHAAAAGSLRLGKRVKLLGFIWAGVVALAFAGVMMLAMSIDLNALNLGDLSIFFGVNLMILMLFFFTAATARQLYNQFMRAHEEREARLSHLSDILPAPISTKQ